MVSREQFDRANARAAEKVTKGPVATAARYDHTTGRVVLTLSNDVELSLPPRSVQGLENATPSQLGAMKLPI